MNQLKNNLEKIVFYTTIILLGISLVPVSAFATQSGGGYTVHDQVNNTSGSSSGNGFSNESGGSASSQSMSGGGYTVYGGAYRSSTALSTPTPPPPSSGSRGGGGGGGSGGGEGGGVVTPALPREDSIISAEAKLIDIQKDGVINILDFNALMVSWGVAGNLAAVGNAFSGDVIIFNALMVYWGITYQI